MFDLDCGSGGSESWWNWRRNVERERDEFGGDLRERERENAVGDLMIKQQLHKLSKSSVLSKGD